MLSKRALVGRVGSKEANGQPRWHVSLAKADVVHMTSSRFGVWRVRRVRRLVVGEFNADAMVGKRRRGEVVEGGSSMLRARGLWIVSHGEYVPSAADMRVNLHDTGRGRCRCWRGVCRVVLWRAKCGFRLDSGRASSPESRRHGGGGGVRGNRKRFSCNACVRAASFTCHIAAREQRRGTE